MKAEIDGLDKDVIPPPGVRAQGQADDAPPLVARSRFAEAAFIGCTAIGTP